MRIFLVALLTVALSAPALAQDGSEASQQRTVESAQQFLAEFGKGKFSAVTMIMHNGSGWQVESKGAAAPGKADTITLGLAHLLSLAPVEKCKSRLVLSNLFKTRRVVGMEFGERLQDGPAITADLDWSTIKSIRTSREELKDPAGGPPLPGQFIVSFAPQGWIASAYFAGGAEEDVNRLAFAMEYLREQCAPKSGTGF